MQERATKVPARQNSPHAVLQRKCACGQHTAGGECSQCQKNRENSSTSRSTLQRKGSTAGPTQAPPIVHDVLKSPGEPLGESARSFFEPRFGHDFSKVRVHVGERAAASADAVNANAYTVGNQIVFGPGKYAPSTREGRGLLGHELTHVVQQRGAAWQPGETLPLSSPNGWMESHAEENSAAIQGGGNLDVARAAGRVELQKDEAEIDKQKAEVKPRFQFDPSILELGLDITKGRHKLGVTGSLSDPINLFGVNLPGFDPSQFLASIQYDNECNQAVQRVLLEFEQDQRLGGRVFDFKRNELRVGAKIKFRLGSFAVEPGGDVSFHGNQVDSVFATFTLTTGVDPTIPAKCISKPTPPKAPDKPDKADKPDKPDKPGKKKDGGTDIPGGPGEVPSKEVKPPADPLTLYFFYDTSILRAESNHTFEYLRLSLLAFPSLQVILIGHTSLEGSDAYNLKLSQSRADAVRSSLTLSGIDNARIRTIAMGESAPAVIEPPEPRHTLGDKLEKLRDKNRRVEVVFFDPTGKFGPVVPNLILSVPERINREAPR